MLEMHFHEIRLQDHKAAYSQFSQICNNNINVPHYGALQKQMCIAINKTHSSVDIFNCKDTCLTKCIRRYSLNVLERSWLFDCLLDIIFYMSKASMQFMATRNWLKRIWMNQCSFMTLRDAKVNVCKVLRLL